MTSKRRIESFVRRNAGCVDRRAAKSALRSVADNAASPPGAFLSVLSIPHRVMRLCPPRIGNESMREAEQKRKIAKREHSSPTSSQRVAPGDRVRLELPSILPRQIGEGFPKRLALADGYMVISVTTRQLCDRSEMRMRPTRRISHKQAHSNLLRQEFRERSEEKPYATGWSLKAYHRREWLKEVSEGGLSASASRTRKDWKIVSGTDLPGIERRPSRGVLVERDRGDLLVANRDDLSVSWRRSAARYCIARGASFCAKCPTLVAIWTRWSDADNYDLGKWFHFEVELILNLVKLREVILFALFFRSAAWAKFFVGATGEN